MTNIPLSQDNLTHLGSKLPSPNYDRKSLKTGIVHIGVGGFHRSHQAYYVHQLLQEHGISDWGICGVGLREADRKIHDILKSQDCLYTLITKQHNGTIDSEIIGSINEFLLAGDRPDLVINKIAHTDTKIVSLTITEGGYNFDPSSGEFNFQNPEIQHDLSKPKVPKTVFGFLTTALNKRRKEGLPAFTILSCDNIQHNGSVTKAMLLAFAEKQDHELAEWIAENVSFPNTMVDRITPVTSEKDSSYLKDKYRYIDQWPVICEPFIQWVVEDKFANSRPPLEKLGVQFVPDVGPYEKMKIRLLNAGHSVLGILGAIHGHPSINACMEDPIFAKYMRAFMDKEVSPVLGEIVGVDLEEYKDNLEERFANPNIKDNVSRICSESSAKLPKFLVPTIEENLASGGSIQLGTMILAAWCYYSDLGIDENNKSIDIIDAMKKELHSSAKDTKSEPTAFLKQNSLFGSLPQNPRFVDTYSEIVESIYAKESIREIMKTYIS